MERTRVKEEFFVFLINYVCTFTTPSPVMSLFINGTTEPDFVFSFSSGFYFNNTLEYQGLRACFYGVSSLLSPLIFAERNSELKVFSTSCRLVSQSSVGTPY